MKKLLIIGPLFYEYSKSVGRAFEKEGFTVNILDEWVEGSIENFKEKITYHIAKDKDAFFNKKYEVFNKKVRSRYNDFKPDIVFIIRGVILTEETLLFMKSSRLVLWMMDSIFLVSNTLKNIALYDHVFLFEKEDIPLLKERHNIDAWFLPLALDESVYFPIPATEKSIDILFVGNLYDKRLALLKKVIEKFPAINIKIYGDYFSKLRNIGRYLFRKDKKYFTNSTVAPSELNKLYSQAKICLNIHHSQSVYGVNQRFFEIAGAGALQVCDSHGFISDNFEPSEILIYNTEDELYAIIEDVLNDYDKYTNNRADAFKKVREFHTFSNRAKYVLQTI